VLFSKLIYKKSITIWHCSEGRSLIPFIKCRELIKSKRITSIIVNFFDAFCRDIIRLYSIRNSNYLISQTENNKDILLKTFNRESIKINKGIEIHKRIQKEYGKKINILFLRNIRERSRLNLFIDIVKKLKETKKNSTQFNFTIIGDNLLKDNTKIINNIKKYKINYLGKIEHDIVLLKLKSTHILIDTLEEVDNITTYSNTYLEAWMNNCIVLSFSANPDNVLDKYDIGFKVNNVDSCVKKILELEKNRLRLKEIGQNAYEYVKRNHSLKKEVDEFEKLMK